MIATKKGDKGETDVKGERLKKHSPRISSIGAVDELNAVIGIARNYVKKASINDVLKQVQNDLFTIQADLAKEDKKTPPELTEFLDKAIEAIEPTLPKQTKFILPSGNLPATYLQFARTVCRRAERNCFKLNEYDPINPEILKYLNRLSDLLHLFARAENDKEEEVKYFRTHKN
ncbi:cob(I)yrinic acid a,c-diamide adenosyltransferase [Candidatus Woesearchaeota archaeon]|nr:cob(I)yrinic acid a,c-diamide adenosyltransferase [Candidatus Woesearchaeota archaeon]